MKTTTMIHRAAEYTFGADQSGQVVTVRDAEFRVGALLGESFGNVDGSQVWHRRYELEPVSERITIRDGYSGTSRRRTEGATLTVYEDGTAFASCAAWGWIVSRDSVRFVPR
jgi:hypothetical protein